MRNDNGQLIDEEKEKARIEWENKVLAILMPVVGLLCFVFGLLGAILVMKDNIGVAVFLIIVAVLGVGGIAYGVLAFLKKLQKKNKKPEKEPDLE